MSALFRNSMQLRKLFRFGVRTGMLLKIERRFHILRQAERNVVQDHMVPHGCRLLATAAFKYELNDDHLNKSESVSLESVDQILAGIDQDAKRFGRISKTEVENVFSKILQLGSATTIQSLYLIRCCGSLMRDQFPVKRIEFVNTLWNKFQELGIPFDASHYNSLLKVYLDNKYEFCPTTFLSNMESKGVEPNRVTYQRLIERFCDIGDIAGASAVLEFMKEKGIAINEAIFNSLIKGHSKAGDFEGAKHMLEVMRESLLKPSADTYCTLACGFALKGDISEINAVLVEAESSEIFLSTQHLLRIIYSLAVSEHKQYVDELLAKVQHIWEYKDEFVNTTIDLVHAGADDVAYKLVSFLAKDQITFNGSHFFIQQLIKNGKEYESVLQYCIDIKNSGISNYIFETAAKAFLEQKNVECALKLYGHMQSQGIPVRCHYFWPILAVHQQKNNESGIWKTLKAMYELGILADFDTYIDFVFPGVDCSNPEAVIQKIKESGQSEHSVVDSLIQYYVSIGDFKTVADMCKNYPVNFHSRFFLRSLVSSYKLSAEHDISLLEIMEYASTKTDYQVGSDIKNGFFDQLILTLAEKNKLTVNLINQACKKNLLVSKSVADAVCRKFGTGTPLEEAMRNIANGNYISITQQSEPYGDSHPRDMNIEDLEKKLEFYKRDGLSVKGILRHLLVLHCKKRNLERVLQIKSELDDLGFIFNPASYALLINIFVSFNQLEEAINIKKKLEEEFPDFKLDAVKALEYMCLLIKSNKVEDALTVLKKDCNPLIVHGNPDVLFRCVRKVLSAAADSGDVELTKNLYTSLTSQLNLKSPKSNLLESLIKVHLVRDDIDKAIEEYKQCILSYHLFPCRNLLMKKCILKDDCDKLQKVVDLTTMYGGKIATLHELALAFIETGRTQQARKVVQTLGGKADIVHLEDLCLRLFKLNKVAELEQFLNITKDLSHIDRDRLYFCLLQLYAQENNYQKALEMWNSMQEENVHPQVRTLRLVAELLEKNEQPVPFIVPEKSIASTDSENILSNFDSDLRTILMESLEKKDMFQVIEALKQMKKGIIRSLSPETLSDVMDLLAVNNCLKEASSLVQVMSYGLEKSHDVFKPLLEKYSSSGNIDVIKSFLEFLPDFTTKAINFNYYFHRAYITSGRHEELISELEHHFGKQNKLFSASGFQEFLEIAPHLEERMAKLAVRYLEEENFPIPIKALWTHYFVHEKYDKAEELYKQNVVHITNADIFASRIIKAIHSTKNVSMGRKFIDVTHAYNMKRRVKCRAYRCLLSVLVELNNISDAIALIKEAQKAEIPITSFNRTTLINLKTALESKNEVVPFEIPEDSSSSSSDSD